jgi:hypothetical protein
MVCGVGTDAEAARAFSGRIESVGFPIGGPMNIGKTGFTQFKGVHMVERADHWAHEEQPEKVSELLTAFLREGG